MANTYQAKHFTGEQLDGFMQKVQDGSVAGRGLEIDQNGVLQNTVLGYSKKIYSYTHTGNKEAHVTAVDIATGVFTSANHGLSTNDLVSVTMNPPHNIGLPYDHLPGGLLLSADYTNNSKSAKTYFVRVVDANSFTLMDPTDATDVVLTENSKMDLTKFHFELVPGGMELELTGLNLQECLIVVKGKIYNSFRWVHPTNRVPFGTGDGNKTGGVSYDLQTGSDNYGSSNLGRPGYNYHYSTVEIKTMGNKQAYQYNDQSHVVYTDANIPQFKHTRQYYHMQLTSDTIEGIKMYGNTNGGFYNGTTVEVYAR